MSQLLRLHLLALLVALCASSCSILRPSRYAEEPTKSEEEVVELIVNDTLAEELTEPTIDTLYLDSIAEELTEQQQQIEQLFFDGAATTSVMIEEYRNVVVEDFILDLSTQSSHYPADGHVTSHYGWRSRRMHTGIDLKAQKGDNLYATFDGVVRLAKYYSSYGYCVVIRHYNGLETLYAHASKLLVEVNDVVNAGDVIALAGSTGRSTGSHLHFEVRVSGNHINPTFILDTENRKIKDSRLYITMRHGKLFASNNDSQQEREAKILEEVSIKYHIVKSGDVLSRIAANNGTTVTAICRLNGISSTSTLRIGQRLKVRDGVKPAATTTTTASSAATTTTPASTNSTSAASGSATAEYHIVKSGDVLSRIAANNGTTVTAICRLNGISSTSTLRIGQRLKVRNGSATSAAQVSTAAAEYHQVSKGDTLSYIARRYSTSVSALCSLNGISSTSTLSINQRIRIR